jgi:predicted nuclease of predicted toxin-antitoxin system
VKIRFQADENLNEDIVTGVLRRALEIDFEFANHAGLYKLPDLEVLAIAARDERILITHDRRSIPEQFAKFIETQTCPGIFIISQKASVARAIEELILIWTLSEAGDYVNSIRILRF